MSAVCENNLLLLTAILASLPPA